MAVCVGGAFVALTLAVRLTTATAAVAVARRSAVADMLGVTVMRGWVAVGRGVARSGRRVGVEEEPRKPVCTSSL